MNLFIYLLLLKKKFLIAYNFKIKQGVNLKRNVVELSPKITDRHIFCLLFSRSTKYYNITSDCNTSSHYYAKNK